MEDERHIYGEGQWWIAVLVIVLSLWFFFGGGVDWLANLLLVLV